MLPYSTTTTGKRISLPSGEETQLGRWAFLQPVLPLALDLVLEVEVSLVEVVDAYVAVLAATRVALACRIRSDRVLSHRVSLLLDFMSKGASYLLKQR